MFRSSDKKLLLLCVPRTGSNSILRLFFPYRLPTAPNRNNHETFSDYCELHKADSDLIEGVYIFWRDPVERFISAVNLFRTDFNMIREYFHIFKELECMRYADPRSNHSLVTNMVSAKPEEFFNNKSIMEGVIHFAPQSKWHVDIPKEKLRALNFSNFEQNIRQVLADYGADSTVFVPRIYQSMITTTISLELEEAIKQYYAGDYAFRPNS